MFAIGESESLLRTRLRQDLLNGVPHLAVASFPPANLLQRIVLVDELVYRHETSTYSDYQIVFHAFHDNLLFEIVVGAVTESHKQALHFLLW